MNNINFLMYLLTVIFGSLAISLSVFSLAAFVYLKMFGIWFLIALLIIIGCSYLVNSASREIFSFIKRHGIS
jgi:uncharacterized membrane protein